MSASSMQSPSVRHVLGVSIPLMLTGATESLMLFCDRVFLARHSIEAMNAASATFMTTAVFVFFGVAIAGVAEVLAGQYNGEKKYSLVGRAIWQMIWFALLTFLVFVPLAIFGPKFLLPESLVSPGTGYFRIISLAAPLWALQAVLAGFFAVTGRSYYLPSVAIVANVVNGVLDYLFIFGSPLTPSLGATGAALGTAIAQALHVMILLFLFFRKKERERYATGTPSWYPKDLMQGISIGLPNALSHGVEITAWAFLYQIAARTSFAQLTVLSSVFALASMVLGFLNEGLKQGVTAVASNLIGASRYSEVKKLLHSGVFLQLTIGFVSFFPLVLFADGFMSLLNGGAFEPELQGAIRVGLFCMWLYIVLDGLVWIINGILTAGGDTKVTMVINIASVWGAAILPTCYFLRTMKEDAPSWLILFFTAVYAFVNLVCHFIRFLQGRWRRKLTS